MKTVIEGLEKGLQDIATALGGGSDIVPTPTAQDEGKVLTANDDGTASWETSQGGLPDYSQSTPGSVLATQYSGDLGWDRPENLLRGLLLPDITGDDDGKVLQAYYNDKSGSYAAWSTPSGGGGIGSETYTVDGSNFVQHGSSYQVVFANDYFPYNMASIISARIYYEGDCSVPCSIIYADKTGMIAEVTADDYAYISSTSGLTLKIYFQNS